MKSHFAINVDDLKDIRKEAILRAASESPRSARRKDDDRRVEQTVRDDEFVFIFPCAPNQWVETPDSIFAQRYRGADPTYLGGVCNQSLAVPVFKRSCENAIADKVVPDFLSPSEVSLAVTKAVQYALLYPTLKFALTELGFSYPPSMLGDELIHDLSGLPSNLLLSGRWHAIKERQQGKKKSARLAVSGLAMGVKDDFVYDEIEEEIKYLRSEGYEEVSLFYFGLHGAPNSRGDIRIPVSCAKLMNAQNVDFFRITFDRQKYSESSDQMFAYLNSWAATHILHFQPVHDKENFDTLAYYQSRGIESRELLLNNYKGSTFA